MDIALGTRSKAPLIIAGIALALVGLHLIFSTWRTLERQRNTVEEHLLLTARSIHQAIESSLKRGFVATGRPGVHPDARAYFRELEQGGDVLFVGVFDAGGSRFFRGTASSRALTNTMDPEVMEHLATGEAWHGAMQLGADKAYVYGKRLSPPDPRPSRLRPKPIPDAENQEREPVYLLIGLNMEKHQSVFRRFHRNALFQAGFILATAALFFILALALLRRQAKARRADYLERFQSKLLDNLPDGLVTIRADGTLQSANPAAHAILGTQPGELAGRSADALPQGVLPPPGAGTGGLSLDWREATVADKRLEVLALPIRGDDDSAPSTLVILRDRTELKGLEEELTETKKLAAVGTLAAGVAHEIRNPLSALRGFAQYFSKKLAGSEPGETYAKTMVQEADRLNRVITDLLFLAKPRPLDPTEVHIPGLADEVSKLLDMDLQRRGVQVTTDLAAQDCLADRDALKQTLINLMLNSLDAMAEAETPEPRITIASRRGERGVWLRVADNGPGMSQEVRQQAFEPFYTGKRSGTGLGLAIVHKTMREHRGTARIDNAPGGGARVSLFFPDTPGAGHNNATTTTETNA